MRVWPAVDTSSKILDASKQKDKSLQLYIGYRPSINMDSSLGQEALQGAVIFGRAEERAQVLIRGQGNDDVILQDKPYFVGKGILRWDQPQRRSPK